LVNTRSALAFAAMSLVLASCTTVTPHGDRGGRIDVSQTTEAENMDHRVNLTDLNVFADSVAEQLVADLAAAHIPELNGQYRVSIIYGDTNNKTDMATTDFEMVRGVIRSKLNNSKMWTDHVRFVTNRARIESIRNREAPPGQNQAAPGSWNPDYTYYLNSDIFQASRGPVSGYAMTFSLVSNSDGAIIWESKAYQTKKAGV
jgi:hypothetical protein